MVRPVHSKRKLFNNAKEHKENTTPDEQLEQFSDSKQNKCVSKSLHSKVSEQLVRPEEKTAHKQRPLPHISSSPASSSCSTADTPCKAVKSSVEGAWKQSHSGEDEGRVSEGVAASTPSRARHAMPMSERQQIALLMQMSSPSNTSKLVQDSSSPSPRCYSPYCDSSDPGTPQQQTVVSGSMVGNNSGPRAGGVGKRNERGETPLHVAAIRGDAERVQQLIARGSDVNAVDYAEIDYNGIEYCNRKELFGTFLDCHQSPMPSNVKKIYFGWTALHEACNRGFVSVAVELINAGASVNAKGLDNETPLHDACVNNHFKLVELLLDSGASTSIVNRRGQTPADVCRSPVILALLQKSARDTSEILDNSICGMSRRAQPCNAGKGLDASRMGPKAEKDVNNKSGDRSCSSVTSSSQAFVSSSSSTSSFSSNYNSNSFGRPSSPRVAMRITASSQARTPDKRNSTDKHFEGRGACDDPYEFKCTKDESRSHSNKDGEGTSGQATFEGKSDVVREEGTEKRDKGNKFTGRGSCSLSSATGSSNFRSSGGATNTTLASSGGASPWGSGSQGSPLDANRKSPQSTSNSPKAGIKVEKYDEAVDEDSPRSDALSSTYNNGNSNNSSPKVPPLKIVLSSCSSNSSNNNSSSSSNGSNGTGSHSTSSLSGIEQEFVGPQGSGSGKAGVSAGSSRHLPYVVASSASGSNSQDNGNSNNCVKDESCSNASQNSSGGATVVSNQDSKDTLSLCVKEEPLSPGGGCGEKSATRITRSQRSNTDDATTSSSVKVEVKEEPVVTTSSSCSSYSTLTTPSSSSSSTVASNSTSTESVHPRKRKINIKEEDSDPPPLPLSEQPLSNCYQMFLVIRKQIDDRRKLLFPVQPKPPQGFKDYLMNRATYVLASNPSSQHSVPMMSPPSSLSQPLKDLFNEQERDRYKLRLQHQIEREKMALSVEQEILRVHGRAAAALANQVLPFSACTILRDQEVYNILTPEQEEKHRNARSRYNGRLFISWLQDVDDKWEKIKESMVLRQQNEAESLHAVHRMDWEWKMKEVGLCDNKSKPVIEELHVPMVAVSDFDLLPT
ncbi:Ankyrin repeat [Trinorchestia longiramus]|nr:Ankyrin repeat [Trinorchestia longiramus]